MKSAPQRLAHRPGETLTLEPGLVVISFKKEPAPKEVEAFLQRQGLVREDPARKAAQPRGFPERLNTSRRRVWARTRTGKPLDEKVLTAAADPAHADWSKVEWIGAVYKSARAEGERAYLCPLPNVLLVKPSRQDEQQRKNVSGKLAQYGLREVPEKSKYLGGYLYFVVDAPLKKSAYEIREEIAKNEKDTLGDIRWETMPLIVPTALVPNDVHFPLQWNMARIRAGGPGTTGWNISTGVNTVVICVLDEGCDLGHPDLQFSSPGINLGTMMPDGSPTGSHGTACAGIAAASIGNSAGVAGVAGNCRILPVAFDTWSDVEVAAGVNFAADNGARVISMSFGWDLWDPAIIDPAIQHAFDSNVVMCVATHNYNSDITYPATNPLVMACGASDQDDERKSPSSPDGECWGSNFGPGISVVAPGVRVPTTDIQDTGGYNSNNGGALSMPCVNYASCGDAAGDYMFIFNGTSAATPHVAGLAALLISYDSGLSNVQVREIIELTADRVGSVPYAMTAGHPNGTWNEEMGYGRINVYSALHQISKSFLKDIIDSKLLIKDSIDSVEVFDKQRRFKEKERIDEVKGRVGFENPEIFDPEIYFKLTERLKALEQEVFKGRAFIRSEERPNVGRDLEAGGGAQRREQPAPAEDETAGKSREAPGKGRTVPDRGGKDKGKPQLAKASASKSRKGKKSR
ncbi:MAG TPA: S8 family serine peptidase [Pyrinomonadaceae bacterium]|nr:S8 family serine peptidase [Pyrinomonadaceae bacterium]